jgi:hypothetical protein
MILSIKRIPTVACTTGLVVGSPAVAQQPGGKAAVLSANRKAIDAAVTTSSKTLIR